MVKSCSAATVLANKNLITERIMGRAVFAPLHLMVPDAACAGLIGFEMLEKGLLTDYIGVLPEYVRKSSAERNLGF